MTEMTQLLPRQVTIAFARRLLCAEPCTFVVCCQGQSAPASEGSGRMLASDETLPPHLLHVGDWTLVQYMSL